MSTSKSTDFDLTRNEIILGALRMIGASGQGKTASATEITDGAMALNRMVKAWQSKGIGLWLNQEVTLFLELSERAYLIGPTGDHCTASYTETALASDVASGASSLTVDSISGITDGDYLGIELDDGTLQWTTVSGSPSGTTVTAAEALTDDAAADNMVVAYTTKTSRPITIVEARRRSSDGLTESPIKILSRDEYMRLGAKTNTATPTQIFYDRRLTNGMLYVYGACDDVTEKIVMTIRRSVEDFDSSVDTADFPPETLEPLTSNLAIRLGIEWGLPVPSELRELAREGLNDIMGYDREDTSVTFRPSQRYRS